MVPPQSNQLWPEFMWEIKEFANTTSAETGAISFGFPAMEDTFNFTFELIHASKTNEYRYEFRIDCKHCTNTHPVPEDFTLTVCLKNLLQQDEFPQSVTCKLRRFYRCKDVLPRVLWSLSKAELEARSGLLYKETDTLTIFCKVVPDKIGREKPEQKVSEEWIMHALWDISYLKSAIDEIQKLFQQSVKPDVYLKCGDASFPAHTSKLSARSSVLKEMINNMSVDQTKTINMEGMKEADLKEFLQYLHWGKLSNISADVAANLYEAAEKYAVRGLKQKCRSYMVGKPQRK